MTFLRGVPEFCTVQNFAQLRLHAMSNPATGALQKKTADHPALSSGGLKMDDSSGQLVLARLFLVLAVIVVGYLEARFGPGYSLRWAFLIPIGMAGWRWGVVWACILAVVGSVMWCVTFLSLYPEQGIRLSATIHEGVVRCVILATFGWGMARLNNVREAAEHAARTDDLTGLENRIGFLDNLAQEASRAKRSGTSLALAFLDCDGFKQVNDQRGHLVGNDVLEQVGKTIRENLRDYDHVARLGGDEFCWLMTGANEAESGLVAERVHLALSDLVQQQPWTVTFSVGVAVFPEPPLDVETMLAHADRLMYEVKHAGKNDMIVRVIENHEHLHATESSTDEVTT